MCRRHKYIQIRPCPQLQIVANNQRYYDGKPTLVSDWTILVKIFVELYVGEEFF
jgi:hypothetical protein